MKTGEITLRNTFCPDKRLSFLMGKFHPTLLRGWLRDTGYQISVLRHYSPYLQLFAFNSSLFATARDCSPPFANFETIPTIRYPLFGFS